RLLLPFRPVLEINGFPLDSHLEISLPVRNVALTEVLFELPPLQGFNLLSDCFVDEPIDPAGRHNLPHLLREPILQMHCRPNGHNWPPQLMSNYASSVDSIRFPRRPRLVD